MSTKNFVPIIIAQPIKALMLSIIDIQHGHNAHVCVEKTSRSLHKTMTIFEYHSKTNPRNYTSIYYNADDAVPHGILCLQILLALCKVTPIIAPISLTVSDIIQQTYLHTQRRISSDTKRKKVLECLRVLQTILCSISIQDGYASKAPEPILTITITDDMVTCAFPLAQHYLTASGSLQYALFPMYILPLCNDKRNTFGFLLTIMILCLGQSVNMQTVCLYLFGKKLLGVLHTEQKRRILQYIQQAIEFYNTQNVLQCSITQPLTLKQIGTMSSIMLHVRAAKQ